MRSRARMIAYAVVLLVIVSSLYSWSRLERPNYLLEGAEDHSMENENTPNHESESHETEKTQQEDIVPEFVQRPIRSYDDAVALNSKTCPTEGVNFDEGTVHENEKKWRALSPAKIKNWRVGIANYLIHREKDRKEKTAAEPTLGEDGNEILTVRGRGIVMAAGDGASVVRARTNIRFLRSYNCSLPIEIFHFPNELSEQDKDLLEELSSLELDEEGNSLTQVTVRVVDNLQKGNDWKAFHIKAVAMQQSSFDEILYLDTDSYPLRNPEYLFESKQWKETGLMLWPDYTKSHATNPIWRILGLECRNEYEGESGQIYISRILHQDLLWVAEYFAKYHHNFYGLMGGDRDSFRAAALLLGKKWTGPGRLNAAAGVVLDGSPQGGGHTMLQSDPEGNWMFVHANLIKHARFSRPLWSKIHRAANDKFAAGSTYGNIDPPNDEVGDGVKLRVTYDPMMSTIMSNFEGYDESSVVVEDWDSYEELKGFEEKWFKFGGVH